MTDKVTILVEIDPTTNQAALNDWLRSLPGVKRATNIKEITLEMGDYYDIESLTTSLKQCPHGQVMAAEVSGSDASVAVTEKGLAEIAGSPSDQELTEQQKSEIEANLTGKGSELKESVELVKARQEFMDSDLYGYFVENHNVHSVVAIDNPAVDEEENVAFIMYDPEDETVLSGTFSKLEEAKAIAEKNEEDANDVEYSTSADVDEPKIKNNEHAGALQFARNLEGRQYREELTKEEAEIANKGGYIVVFGASDDLTEFRGAVHDELGAYDGGHFVFDDKEKTFVDLEEVIDQVGDDGTYTEIKAEWSPEESDLSWAMHTNLEAYGRFTIKEDDGVYGEGLVFHVSELKPFNK